MKTVKRFIAVQSHPEDTLYDWYIVNTASVVCVEQVSSGYGHVTDWIARLNMEAS